MKGIAHGKRVWGDTCVYRFQVSGSMSKKRADKAKPMKTTPPIKVTETKTL